MLVADPFAAGRVFLAGEAAHVNPPWGGHGFNTSVGDAVNIAWKIAAVEHGWAPPELLASYEAERRGVAEQTVACAESNMRGAGRRPARRRGGHPAGEAVRVLQPRPGARLLLRGLAADPARHIAVPGHGLHQPTRPAAQPGARLPHAWFPDGTSLYDRLGTGFTLLGPAGCGDAPGRACPRARHPAHRRGAATGLPVAR